MVREMLWQDLPHDQQVGYGQENKILKLSDRKCIVVYSQRTVKNAETELRNYHHLIDAGFLVPQPIELVNVVIDNGSRKYTHRATNHNNLESVPGLIKEFISGEPSKDREKILEYIDRLHEAGFTFRKGVSRNFIESQDGLFLVDCSYMLLADNCWHFETACRRYRDKIEHDLQLIEYFDNSSDPEDLIEPDCLETVLGAFGIQ